MNFIQMMPFEPRIVAAIITAAGAIAASIAAIVGEYVLENRPTKGEGDGNDGPEQQSDATNRTPSEDENYSQYRQWLKNKTDFIDIRGIGVGTNPGLEAMSFKTLDLYTELHVQQDPSLLVLSDQDDQEKQRIPLTEVLENERRVVITGGPGAGKTTFLRYAAQRNLMNESEILPFFLSLLNVYESTVPDSEDEGKRPTKSDIGPTDFLDYLVELGDNNNFDLDREEFKCKAESGKCLWLLDSLDELPTVEAREMMADAITRASQQWDNCSFAVTSRPVALSGKAVPIGFEPVPIGQFEETEIASFLDTWTTLLYEDSSQKQREYREELYSAIVQSPYLKELASNPVMLTSMAVVHHNQNRLPEGRAELLESVIHWLVHSRDQEKRYTHEQFDVEELHRELALHMFEAGEGRRLQVGRRWAAKKLSHHFNGSLEAALEFLDKQIEETGLLERRGEGDVAFKHVWFQEYLAAKEISGLRDDKETGWWAKIRDHLEDDDWREVLTFIPFCLNRLGSDRVDLFFERLGESCLNNEIETKIKRAGLGGRILRDIHVIGYQPSGLLSWDQALEDIYEIFEDEIKRMGLEDQYEAAVAYGLAGDERLADFDETWVSLPGGRFKMGAQAEESDSANFDPLATEWEGPPIDVRIPPFSIRKYPITVDEYSTFLSEGGYENRENWTLAGWKWRRQNNVTGPNKWDEQKRTPNCPVVGVSWFEAVAYCRWLTSQDSMGDMKYKLPSESMWEYAARRGMTDYTPFPWGNEMKEGDNAEANWTLCGLRTESPVGMFPESNTPDGVSDMIGNVEEWCADHWCWNYEEYPQDGASNSNETETKRVVRGGSTIRVSRLCRPTYRSRIEQSNRYRTVGFRPIRIRQ